ncbi:MAG: putative manganese-dependent inorganic diphosphatase [Clostridia bacterium]|nr:putative manganese-dependent inorganic diphosphatase [Clostridia bacterium]
MNKEEKKTVWDPKEKDLFIFGHKNPDTDSICSTLAYARLKEKMGYKHVHACRLGDLNKETTYVLNRFNIEPPYYLETIKPQVRDIKFYDTGTIGSRCDIKTARIKMKEGGTRRRIIPVTSDKGKLIGVVSNSNIMNSIENFYESESFNNEIYISNLINNLNPYEVFKKNEIEKVNGKIYVDSSAMKKVINKHDIIIATNENLTRAILEEYDEFILVVPNIGNVDFVDKYKEKKNVMIIKTELGLLNTLYMIAQSISVFSVMSNEEIEYFQTDDYLEDVLPEVTDSKFTHFPIVDEENMVIGVLSRRHLINYQKKNVVLIDHNEKAQTVNGISEANILEIIDHHKIDGVTTNYPPLFRVEPVGCSSTIIYKLFRENNIAIDDYEAVLMLSSILSDTLCLKSPTCTKEDVKAATDLSKICNLKIDEYGKELISSSFNIKDNEWVDVIRSDLKRFKISDYDIEISNLNISDYNTLLYKKDFIKEKMLDVMNYDRADTIILMLTDITYQGAWIICAGRDEKLFNVAFGIPYGQDNIFMPDVLSRKKQVLPKVLNAVDIISKS